MTRRERVEPPLHAVAGLLRDDSVIMIVPVRGDSMRPILESGRRVQASFAQQTPRFGDLVVFRQSDYLAVHRCLGFVTGPATSRHLRTRGDGRTACDGPVRPEDVLGRVIAVERADGWRSTEGSAARAYAVAVAIHDRVWSLVGGAASRGDAALGRGVFRPPVEAVDGFLLRLMDTMFFAATHRRIPSPSGPTLRSDGDLG